MKDIWIVANGVVYRAIEFNDLAVAVVDVETHQLHRIGYNSDARAPRFAYASLAEAQRAAKSNPLAMRRTA